MVTRVKRVTDATKARAVQTSVEPRKRRAANVAVHYGLFDLSRVTVAPDPLRDALEAYVRGAFALLDEACRDVPDQPFPGFGEWKRAGPDAFILRDRFDRGWQRCLMTRTEKLKELPDYQRAASALREDPEASAHMDALVGTAIGASRVEEEALTNHTVWMTAERTGGFGFSDSAFVGAYAEFREDLARSHFRYFVVAPIVGLTGPDEVMQLSAGVELGRLSDDEISRCLHAGLMRSQFFGFTNVVHGIGRAEGVRIRYELPKRIVRDDDVDDDESARAAMAIQSEAVERAQSIVEALRIFKAGSIAAPGFVAFATGWPLTGSTSFAPFMGARQGRFGFGYTLTTNEAQAFSAFWRSLLEARQNHVIEAAARRMGFAGDRERPDDRLVDLLIAAETLFLSDVGHPQQRGELRFRLALRAASYLAVRRGRERRLIYDQMRRAYDARSAIVHGGDPDPRSLRLRDGSTASLVDFVQDIEAIIRAGLRKAIDEHVPGRAVIADWDDLILGRS